MNDGIAMDSPLAGNVRPEKILWYQEVLSLDPDSRIFLPYARLLAELGRPSEAIDVLRTGLTRHPEFLEARLLLIEMLHDAGQDVAAGFEADGIIEQLSQSSALWKLWSRKPDLRADQAAMLLYFGSSLQKTGLSLTDVFEAGIAALSGEAGPHAPTRAPMPMPEVPALPELPTEEAAAPRSEPEVTASVSEPEMPAPLSEPEAPAAVTSDVPSSAFVMDSSTEWYSLDAVPEDDDIYGDEDEAPTAVSPVQALLFAEAAAASASLPATEPSPSLPVQDDIERIPVMATVPRGVLEGKSSLCTRSMAKVLEEQGATSEAAEIYRELLENCSSPEEKAELNAKLASLIEGAENNPAQASASGIFDLLETLAVRLENRSRV